MTEIIPIISTKKQCRMDGNWETKGRDNYRWLSIETRWPQEPGPSFHWCYAKHCTHVTNFRAIQRIWNPAVQHWMLASLIRQCTEFLRICHRSFAFSQDFAITSWSWKHLRVDVISVIFSSLHRTILFLSSVQAILRNASHTESLGLISLVSGRHIMVSLPTHIVR